MINLLEEIIYLLIDIRNGLNEIKWEMKERNEKSD